MHFEVLAGCSVAVECLGASVVTEGSNIEAAGVVAELLVAH